LLFGGDMLRLPLHLRAGTALALLALAAYPARAEPALPAVTWDPVAMRVRGEEVTSLGFEARTDRVAIGTRRGVLAGRLGGEFARTLRRGPVRDVAFLAGAQLPEGALLASTDDGLHRIDDGGVATFSPGTGESARVAGRIAVANGAVAVATAAGAFASTDTRSWQSLSTSLPAGAATAIALRGGDDGFECWTAIRGRLWRTRLRPRGDDLIPDASRRVTLPMAAADGGPVDVVFDLPGADVAVVLPRVLAMRDRRDGEWAVLRPELPGGAHLRRLAHALGRFWLATDRGLLEAPSLAGPWRRAASPAGTAAARDIAVDEGRLVVATVSGVVSGRVRVAQSVDERVPADPWRGDPSVEAVHRAAVGYLDLSSGRLRALRRSVNRSGLLPVASLRAGYDDDRANGTDDDEAFVSGEVRRLRDRDVGRSRDLEVAVTLSWDLGNLVYHPEQVDVSREMRALVELRDDVLDEITQLYYERRRVLAELAVVRDPAAQVRLRLRGDELAAGIDAWTGGWFGRHTQRLAP
jgi:ligand-binding sensor domain-containing protein